MSNSSQPCGLQPARLHCPWDFSGKNTGVGCHGLLQGIFPDPEIEFASPASPASAGRFFSSAPPGKPKSSSHGDQLGNSSRSLQKACINLVHGFGEGSRVVKRLPCGCKERLQAEALISEGFPKGRWAWRLLVLPKGEPFQEILAQPSLGSSQLAEVSHVGAHLLDEFHLLFEDAAFQEVRGGGLVG